MSLSVLPVMSRLRNATVDLEEELENALAREPPTAPAERYRVFLARMYGFHAPLERRLHMRPDLAHILPDVGTRQKAPLIAVDLTELGVVADDLDDLPRCPDLPDLADVAAALGCVYVLESTAGAMDAMRAALPVSLAARSSYLQHAGEDADPRWRTLIEAIESHAKVRMIGDRVVAGANETLDRLTRWLSPAAKRLSVAALR